MWKPRFSLISYHGYLDDDGGDGGDQGGGGPGTGNGDQGDKGAAQADPRMDQLVKAVGILAQGQSQLTQGLTQLSSKLEQFGQGGGDKGGDGGEGGDGGDVDYETMDRRTFAAHITSSIKGLLQEAVKPLNERFGQLDEKIDGQTLGSMIKEFSSNHPDFYEWTPEIRQLAKENPTLTPARLYTIARAEDPKKAKLLDDKFGLNQPKKPGADILSLFPTSTGGGSATKGAGRMSPKQAAEAAWDSVMSQMSQPGSG